MGRMTDEQLVAMAIEYKAHKADEANARARADEVRDQLVDELRRRKVPTGGVVEIDGWAIHHKAKRTKVWSADVVKKVVPRRLWPQVLRTEVAGPALEELAKAGVVSAEARAQCLVRVDESQPYVDVRPPKAA